MVGQPYTVTPCECGHTEALHASARTSWPHPPERGVCLVAGCDCKTFTPTSSRREPRNEQGSQDSSNACRDGSDVPAGRHRDRGDITADREAEAGAGHGIGTEAEPLVLELVHTRVRALAMGLTCGSALGALTVLLVIEVLR